MILAQIADRTHSTTSLAMAVHASRLYRSHIAHLLRQNVILSISRVILHSCWRVSLVGGDFTTLQRRAMTVHTAAGIFGIQLRHKIALQLQAHRHITYDYQRDVACGSVCFDSDLSYISSAGSRLRLLGQTSILMRALLHGTAHLVV
ncbi:MAG: hypothetical protein KatS3mg038_2990 [Candidatus Kapaibacterium sp.]|nr:MAG: hypothetical protein KatS3mg038_2990 [Candidatus Kapabacteria bacterium]